MGLTVDIYEEGKIQQKKSCCRKSWISKSETSQKMFIKLNIFWQGHNTGQDSITEIILLEGTKEEI